MKELHLRHVLSGLVAFIFLTLALGSVDSEPPGPREVEYRVKGTSFSLTYNNSQGNTEQIDSYSGNWSHKFTTSERMFFAYVSAQNKAGYGSITAEVWVDGKKVESSSSSGAHVIASASCSVN